MQDIIHYILIAAVTIIPILIWGYVFSIHGANIPKRDIRKFFLFGIISAIIIYCIRIFGKQWWYDIFDYGIQKTSIVVTKEILVLIGICLLIYGWRIASWKQAASWLGLILWGIILSYISNSFASGMLVLSIFLLALIEEITKWFASIGRYKILPLIGIYSALGFVFLENFLYIKEYPEFFVFFGRSVISLLLHVSSTFLLLLSIHVTIQKKISPILGGIFALTLSTLVHTTYNISLQLGSMWLLITLFLAIISYMMITYCIQKYATD